MFDMNERRRDRGTAEPAGRQPRSDRRARRRQETIEEILDIAEDVMAEEGVNGLSLAEVARRLGVQPPSLYKYFPSLHGRLRRPLSTRVNSSTSTSCVKPWPSQNPDWPP